MTLAELNKNSGHQKEGCIRLQMDDDNIFIREMANKLSDYGYIAEKCNT